MEPPAAGRQPASSRPLLSPAYLFIFILEISALAAFLWHQGILELIGRRNHSVLFYAVLGFPAAILVGAAAFKSLGRYSFFLASRTRESRRPLAQAIVLTLTPLLFLCLIFLQHLVFLREIGPAVVLASLAGFLCLHGLFLSRINRQFPGKVFRARSGAAFSPHVVLFLFFVFYAFLASGLIFPAQPFTGDEPHYLVLTKSLLSDRDLNLSNNYANRDYLQFYPGELRPHTRTGKKGAAYQYSLHAPGLPLLLIPFYYAGEKISSVKSLAPDPEARRKTFVFLMRLPLCFLAALLGFLVFRLTRDVTGSSRASWAAWLIFGLTPPLLFYSALLYSEIPTAIILIWIFRSLVINRNIGDGRCLAAGLGAAFLPWLGIKYTILIAGLSLLAVFSLIRAERGRARKFILFVSPLLVSAGLYIFYLWSLYGYISPFAPYEGTLDKNLMVQRFFHFSPVEFFRCGLAYLFDQRVGLLAYSPVYLLFFPGIFLAWKKSRRAGGLLLAVFSLHWAFCSLAYYWGGFCPPGRMMLPVLWVTALFLAYPLASGSGGLPKEEGSWKLGGLKKAVVQALLVLSLLVAFLTMRHPQLLYHENLARSTDLRGTSSHLLASLSNAFIDFRGFVPSLSGRNPGHWPALAAWILAALLLIFLFMKKKRIGDRPVTYGQAAWPLLFVHGLSALFIVYVFFNIRLNNQAGLGPENVTVYFQDDNHYGPELDGFWTAGQSRARLLIQSKEKVNSIAVTLSSPLAGKTIVQVGRSKEIMVRNKAHGLEQTAVFPAPVGFPWKGRQLTFLQVQESGVYVPYELDRRVQDNRRLGVFVKIQVK
jgi:hypothetical protein